jgi:DNA-binding CsgD family transcriptional regulator
VPADRAPTRLRCPILVGRGGQLKQLETTLAEVVRGQGRGVLIAGQAGGGKSALLREFVERSRRAGMRVFSGECAEAETRRPLGPFIDLLRSAAAGRDAALVRAALQTETPELARFLTEDRTAAETQAQTYHRAGTAFASLLVALARAAPVMVVVEDIHWADEVTWEVFTAIARRCARARLLLIGTYRSDELHRLHPLRGVLADLARLRVETLTIAPLSNDDAATMVRATLGLGGPIPARIRSALIERCEGNPFFIEETLKALAERGDLRWERGGWVLPEAIGALVTPPSVRDAVLERLAPLTADARRALQIAAVVGQRFDFALVRELSGLDDANVLDALRAAIDGQLVEERDEDDFQFRHALTRESILSDLLQRERRVLHQRVAEAIERRSGADPTGAGQLAYHFDEAGDDLRARRYHALAARSAGLLMANVEAVRHVERAIALSPADDADLLDLYEMLVEYSFRSFNWRRALRAAEEAENIAAARGAEPVRGAMVTRQAFAHGVLGDADRSSRAVEQAIRILEPLGDSFHLAMAYMNAAWRHWHGDGDLTATYVWSMRAREVASRCGATTPLVFALEHMGLSAIAQGDLSGMELLREALQVATERKAPTELHRAYNSLIVASLYLGDREEADRLRAAQQAHFRMNGYRNMISVERECALAVREGRWDEAVTLADEFAGTGAQQEAMTRIEIALIRVAREGPAQLGELDAPVRAMDTSPVARTKAAYAALTISLAGDHAAALAHAERFLGPRGNHPWHYDDVVVGALFDAIDAGADTQPWIARGLKDDLPRETPTLRARRLVAEAVRDGAAGGVDAELRGLEEAIVILDAVPSPYLATRARCRRATLLAARGESAAAEAEMDAAVAFWRDAGATWFVGELRRWAAAHDVPFPKERAADTTKVRALTAREQQVVTLVARGLTNKQIAETLVISERTAESHLERIRGKLGASNRAQIAVWATESGLA